MLPCLINPSLYVMPINAALLTTRGKTYGVVSERRGALLYIYRVCV